MTRHTRQSSQNSSLPTSLQVAPTNNPWLVEEDERLRQAMCNIQSDQHHDLTGIVQSLFPDGSHTTAESLERWEQLRKIQTVKGPWSQAEDAKLKDLIKEHGPEKWAHIAATMRTRSGKQCRERWHNHLDPSSKLQYVCLGEYRSEAFI